jgi:hypothetical protein
LAVSWVTICHGPSDQLSAFQSFPVKTPEH